MCKVVNFALVSTFFFASSNIHVINAFTQAARRGELATVTRSFTLQSKSDNNSDDEKRASPWPAKTRREMILEGPQQVAVASALLLTTSLGVPKSAQARLDPVNKPELLPSDPDVKVIQVEKFLTGGQVKRLDKLLTGLEKDTGFRVRVLCQAYPQTPGLAIRDYWSLGKEGQKDDKYAVLVVDQFGGKGNVLNFNVGEGMKLNLPNQFWTRLQSKYGTIFFVRENGIDISITNAIEAIVTCLRSEDGYCIDVPDAGVSLKSLGM